MAPKKEVEKPQDLVFDLGISTNKGRVPILLGKSGKVREFVRGSGKVREENFYPCKFLTFKKNRKKMHVEMCAVELYMTISCIYDAIICI